MTDETERPHSDYTVAELVANLRDQSKQIGEAHSSYGCIGCNICTNRNGLEYAADNLEWFATSPARVQPTRDEIAEAVSTMERFEDLPDAILALLASMSTVAEVQAATLREAGGIARDMADNEADGYYGQACYEVATALRSLSDARADVLAPEPAKGNN